MKKFLSGIIVSSLLVMSAAMGAGVSAAGNSAYDKESFRLSAGSLLYDNRDNSGGSNGNAFAFVDGYGTGYTDQGDMVVYEDVDFGAKGASKVTVNYGFHNPDDYKETSFAVYIDTPYGEPVANFTVKHGETPGATIPEHKEFTADVAVSGGKHDVYVLATNKASGSFDYIYFTESASKISKTKTVASEISYPALQPFGEMKIGSTTVVMDNVLTQDKGGNNTSIDYMEAYGVGNSSLNDFIVFPNCDFGDKGAKEFKINFAYGNDDNSTTKIGVFVDNPFGEPAAVLDIGFTGGWDLTCTKEFTTDIDVDAGVHTVFVRFMNEKSGSFGSVSFVEGDTVRTAPATADIVVVPAIAAIVSLAGVTIAIKKRSK